MDSVIDFRFRPPTAPFIESAARSHGCVWWKTRATPLWREASTPEAADDASLDGCVSWMRERGVIGVLPGRDMACTSIPNDHLHQLTFDFPDRFVAVAGADPSRGEACLAEVARCLDLGFKGVHLEVGWLQPPLPNDDPSIFPLYELCAARGAVVLIHVGPLAGPELAHGRPDAVCRVARRFPQLRIVMAHAAYPHAGDAVMAVLKHDNIWLEPDPYHEFPGGEFYREWANRSDYVAERMLYGASFGWPHTAGSLEHFVKLGWRDEVLERVLWSNGAQLLGLA